MTAPLPICFEGHVKRDPVTNRVALRTRFPEDEMPDMAWLVSTTNFGSKYVSSALVDGWDDLHEPPPRSAENVQPTEVQFNEPEADVYPPVEEPVVGDVPAPAEERPSDPADGEETPI